jgi:hypothetical protein
MTLPTSDVVMIVMRRRQRERSKGSLLFAGDFMNSLSSTSAQLHARVGAESAQISSFKE